MAALITIRNSPNVRMIRQPLSSCSTGLTTALNAPSTAATITITRICVARVAVFRWMPGTRAVARATASELTSHLQSMDPFYPLQLSGS